MDEKVNFSYPEGFKEAAEWLDFLPADQREGFLIQVIPEVLNI